MPLTFSFISFGLKFYNVGSTLSPKQPLIDTQTPEIQTNLKPSFKTPFIANFAIKLIKYNNLNESYSTKKHFKRYNYANTKIKSIYFSYIFYS